MVRHLDKSEWVSSGPFFAATPMMMLFGLVKGFLGSGTAENVVGFFWFMALSYFILCAVVRARVGGAAQ